MTMKTAITLPSFRDCAGFDFRALSNYVPPERTMQRADATWLTADSAFYSIGETIMFQECCERRKDSELEFARVKDESMTWELADAMRCVFNLGHICPDMAEADLPLVEAHGATHFFRLSTVTTRRGYWNIAYVKNNTLFFV